MRQLTNNATTTLAITLLNTDLTAGIFTDGSVFPSAGDFIVGIEDEFILITARSGNNFTCIRGQEGTTIVTHAAGTAVKLVLSAGTTSNLLGAISTIGGYASRPATARPGTQYFANDIDAGWQFNGTNWDLIHPLFVPYAKRVDVSGWTAFNQGTSTWTDYNGILNVKMPVSGGDALRGFYKTLPSAPYKINCVIKTQIYNQQYNAVGMALYDLTKFRTMWSLSQGSGAACLSVDAYNSVTSFNSTQARRSYQESRYMYFRITDDNTNWDWYYSRDGRNWTKIYSVARNNFLTATKVALLADRSETTYPSDVAWDFLSYWEE